MTTPAVLYDHIPLTEEDAKINQQPSNKNVHTRACPLMVDDEKMETILENSSTDYVLVSSSTPHPEPTLPIPGDSLDAETIPTGHIASYSAWWMLLKSWATQAAEKSMEWTHGFSPSSSVRSSAIYSSYDWVSDTMIDSGGGRLILPGQLIVLDSANHVAVQPPASDPASSIIMVSAHDLLATQTPMLAEEQEVFARSTTASVPEKLFRIVKRKATKAVSATQQTLIRSTGVVVELVGSHLTRLERSTGTISMASDFVSGGYDWCFPANGREDEDTTHRETLIELTSTG